MNIMTRIHNKARKTMKKLPDRMVGVNERFDKRIKG